MKHFYQEPHMGENWFNYERLYSKAVDLFPTGSHFVEIGCWKGKSSVFMAVEIINSGKKIKFDCIDTFIEKDSHLDLEMNLVLNEFKKNIEPVNHIINLIHADSSTTAANYQDESIDFIFIDGDHSYEGVIKDLKAWIPKIKKTGVISGHDYGWHPPVHKACDDIFGVGDYTDPWGIGCFWINKSDI